MQQHLERFEREGTALFAISYDSVAVLRAFADKRGITYPLLSDEGSQVIRALGLLNKHLEEQSRFYGVTPRAEHQGTPYPGSFLLDEDGVVVAKQFEQSYRHRPAASLLLDEGAARPDASATTARAGQELQVTAWLDTRTYQPYQKLRLRLDFHTQPGLHVYASPTPEGYTPLTMELAGVDGISTWPLDLPAPQPFHVEGLDEEFLVHAGTFSATLPFSIDANAGDIDIQVQIHYQACSETVCFPPATISLAFPLQGRDLIRD